MVDLETTGFPDDADAELLEFGAVLLDPGQPEVRTLGTLLRPSGAIPPAITRLTGIGARAVERAPRFDQVQAELARALAGRRLVAHNADFERAFLERYGLLTRPRESDLDTQDLLALTHPDAPDLRLESFTRRLFGEEERHRALEDALHTARVLDAVASGAERGELRYQAAAEALARFSPESPWAPLVRASLDLSPGAEAGDTPSATVSAAEEPVPFERAAIAAALRDEERGARYFPGYRAREEQVELALAVVQALEDGEVLLLEGGTGVGKSLAYLAALIPFVAGAPPESDRAPVLISTRTKLLQDQLLDKDIPAAARFLGYPALRSMSIKGRGNYACERRLAGALAEGLEPSIFPGERFSYALLAGAAAIRPHGELAALPTAWLRRYPALGDLLRRSVATRAEQCTREECAHHPHCPLGRRRAALAKAELIVANHDLLLRWPSDYPDFSHVVVDEAHELAGVADEVYATTVRPVEVIERFDELFGRPAAGGAEGGFLPAGKRRAFRKDATAWRRTLRQDFAALGRSLAARANEFGEVQIPVFAGGGPEGEDDWIDPELSTSPFRDTEGLAEVAALRLENVVGEVETELGGDPEPAVRRGLDTMLIAAGALRDAFAGKDDAVAAFDGIEAPYDRWTLSVRPLSPASAFREALLERAQTFVGVSASLLIGGSAFAAMGELEIEEQAGERLRRISLPSPFDYAAHMRVVALRERGDVVALTAEAIERLAVPLGGRTLALFTSLRRMRDVAERLAPVLQPLGIEIITPRRAADDPSALLERFRRGSAVLLGARKFWQGIDLPGETLQAVVIEKLPFEVPTELRRRRELRLRRARRDPFEESTLGKMLLNLKQMAGRLIRSEDDRGLVVIVESRSDRRYFARVREALPAGCPVVVAELGDLDALLKELRLP